jgi:hypothetical protein
LKNSNKQEQTDLLLPQKLGKTEALNSRDINGNDKHAVRFEVFTAMTMKNGVFWDVTPWDSCKNRRFGGTSRLHHQGDNSVN